MKITQSKIDNENMLVTVKPRKDRHYWYFCGQMDAYEITREILHDLFYSGQNSLPDFVDRIDLKIADIQLAYGMFIADKYGIPIEDRDNVQTLNLSSSNDLRKDYVEKYGKDKEVEINKHFEGI